MREGWPRWKSSTQRLPFDEEQWRRKPLKNLIGLSKAQNVRRVIRFTENLTQGALERLPTSVHLHSSRRPLMKAARLHTMRFVCGGSRLCVHMMA